MGILTAFTIPKFNEYHEKSRQQKVARRQEMQKNGNYSTMPTKVDDSVICIEGFKFIQTKDNKVQIINQHGYGIKCSD